MAKKGRPKKAPISKKIQDALGVAEEEISKQMPKDIQDGLVPEVDSPEVIVESAPRISKDAKDDYEFARANLHTLLVKGNVILEGIVDVAKDSDSPRTYEVAGAVLKTLIEGTRELMTLQKDIRDVEKKTVGDRDEPGSSVQIAKAENVNQNIVMEATTVELLEYFEQVKKKKQEKKDSGE